MINLVLSVLVFFSVLRIVIRLVGDVLIVFIVFMMLVSLGLGVSRNIG